MEFFEYSKQTTDELLAMEATIAPLDLVFAFRKALDEKFERAMGQERWEPLAWKTFSEAVEDVADGRDFNRIAGLSFRNSQDIIVHNEDRAVLDDMDQLPFVTPVYKRDLVIEMLWSDQADMDLTDVDNRISTLERIRGKTAKDAP